MFKFPNKTSLTAYIAGTTPKAGIHTVEKDESFYNEKIEYLFKDGTLTRMTNPKIEYIKRNNINTFAELASVSSPVNKNMIVVLKDENTYNKTTWYTYNVDTWVLMGEYLGKEIKKAVSAGNTRESVIAADTDYTIPLEYTFGKQELSIYVEGYKLSSTDFVEVGTDGVLSSKVQFKNAIMVSSEIEYVREVNTNQTIEPTYQIVQQKIQDDTIHRQRTEYLNKNNYVYGGAIQDCTKRDYSKVYWCNINQKFYKPSIKSIVPNLTADSTNVNGKTYVTSASSVHPTSSPAWHAFDGNYASFWRNIDDGNDISLSNPEWIKIDMGEQTPITGVILVSRDSQITQIPADFYIEGSNDNSTFTKLKTVTDADLTNGYGSRMDKDIIAVEANYRYYRITITKCMDATENCTSLQHVLFLNNTQSTWSVADTDWEEFTDIEGKTIDFTPTLNLLGTTTYSRRMGKITRNKNGYDITVQLLFSCNNLTQDSATLELTGLPFSIAGGSVASCMTEGITFPGSLTPATIKAYTHMGSDKARTQSIKFAAQNVNGRVSQYTTLSRAACVSGAMYIFFTMSIVNDKL